MIKLKLICSLGLVLTFMALSSTQSFAQAPSYKNFEWEILKVGYGNIPNSIINSSGVAIGGEVRYNISDYYSIGLGTDFLFSFANAQNDNIDGEFFASSTLSVDRYFSNTSGTRTFVGAAIGSAQSTVVFIRNGEETERFGEETSVALGLRGGIEIGHLRLTAQYQYTPKSTVSNGIGITAGLTLWGGYKGNDL